MTVDQVFDYFGSRGAVARALGITYEAVRQWEYTGSVPIRRQYEIERLSGGKLTPDVAKTPAISFTATQASA
ncbi:Cro/CI family transcriptional regulator [Microbulbifer sp. 2205BS26-8]|uniref:Cro/CI family transcriptional regulator n=1 Tax=Microbulbifer sp. 2205BS26-8 TaxID=3064386 RepID=UPI002633CB89|nr:Cro/CI family transcriptional regulator [Microbulbifer sp. 2205BS26-8]MDP5211145.1 Cro/CI family transcriptional regulator [Microbulbifer sp. 2205BS26-8]